MARTVNKAALEEKIRKLEGAIRKNREQYDRLTADLDETLVTGTVKEMLQYYENITHDFRYDSLTLTP